MYTQAPEIRSIPIEAITVLNPRVRNKKIFNELVMSIAHLGLKRPIIRRVHLLMSPDPKYDWNSGQSYGVMQNH